MTEDEYREKQARGLAARKLIEDPTFQSAFSAVHAAILQEWIHSSPSAPSLRERKHAEIIGLLAIESRLQQWVDDAKISAVTLEKQRR